MSDINSYYKILGITTTANLEELKRAYRKKALLLHPDRNPSPNAHEEFIFLAEAYDFLLKLKTKTIFPTSSASRNTTTPTNASQYQDWQAQQRAETRKRAAEYAKMKYDEFIKSDYYQNFQSLDTVFTYFYILLGIILALSILTFMFIKEGWISTTIAFVIFTLISIRLSKGANLPRLRFNDFTFAFRRLSRTKSFAITCISILNLVIFFRIGLQTLITTWWLLVIYLASMILTFISTTALCQNINPGKRLFRSFCLAPLAVSLLLTINFIFGRNPVNETYRFYINQSTTILLEDNRYKEYPGIRTFADYQEIQRKKYITYTFKDGLLGFRVMTKYKFDD